ncbi:MAG: hypothetical protein IJM39_04135 [Firmicutes bacterium]|nr:hypothetical protein [Bacillota bacterium]
MTAFKRILIILIIMLLLAALVIYVLNTACSSEAIHEIPSGYTSKETHWDPNGGQDYTDYCKYTYKDASGFAGNKDYNKAAAADIETIKGYFANFREWMNVEDRLDEYDFDPACIDTEDYFRLTERYPNYDDYTLWFFDMQTLTLYYIHTNI